MRKEEKGKGGKHVVEGVIIMMGRYEVGKGHNRAWARKKLAGTVECRCE